MKKRTWLWIAVGVLTVLAVGCFAVIGTSLYVVYRQLNISQVETATAEEQFEAVRERFRGQTPLLSPGADRARSIEALQQRASEYSGPPPHDLHLLAWDAREGRLVRLAVPFWLLRLGSAKSRLAFGDFDFERLQVSVDDLERAGAALVLDESRGSGRVLLWTE